MKKIILIGIIFLSSKIFAQDYSVRDFSIVLDKSNMLHLVSKIREDEDRRYISVIRKPYPDEKITSDSNIYYKRWMGKDCFPKLNMRMQITPGRYIINTIVIRENGDVRTAEKYIYIK